MKTIQYQHIDAGGSVTNIPPGMVGAFKQRGATVRELVDRAEIEDLIKRAQAVLTDHMQPCGPSKSDTIKALNDLLLIEAPKMLEAA